MTSLGIMNKWDTGFAAIGALALLSGTGAVQPASAQSAVARPAVLKAEAFRHYVDAFNQNDHELYVQHIPNAAAWEFLKNNIPLLDCPDKDIEEIYYFRWWTFRKAHQADARRLHHHGVPAPGRLGRQAQHDQLRRRPSPPRGPLAARSASTSTITRSSGSARAAARGATVSGRPIRVWAPFLVTGDDRLLEELLPDLIANYEAWEKTHRDANGLFWQIDDRDGMEVSIGGSGYRATINSYMYGDALAIARIAERAGRKDARRAIPRQGRRDQAAGAGETLGPAGPVLQGAAPRREGTLWPTSANCTAIRPGTSTCPTRTSPSPGSRSWTRKASTPRSGRRPPSGGIRNSPSPTRATSANGTAQAGPSPRRSRLTAMANLLNDYRQDVVRRRDYFDLLKIYTRSQHLQARRRPRRAVDRREPQPAHRRLDLPARC